MTSLIRFTQHNHANQRFQIVSGSYKFISQKVQGLRMAGGIVITKVIDGLDNASTNQMSPDSIHKTSRKVTVVRVCDQASELSTKLTFTGHAGADTEASRVALRFG